VGINNELPYGATPIDPEEAEGLIPSISTRAELNAFEALNIAEALGWAHGNRKNHRDLLSIETLRLLHKRMFNKTWRWAGAIRITEKSIGVAPHQILPCLRALTDDVKVWLDFGSYPPREISARFHHRLVQIHPFPNGNGRHARFATDLLCERQGWMLSEWGSTPSSAVERHRRCFLNLPWVLCRRFVSLRFVGFYACGKCKAEFVEQYIEVWLGR
jgi:Fic-DOC domain mobile mystery protein B